MFHDRKSIKAHEYTQEKRQSIYHTNVLYVNFSTNTGDKIRLLLCVLRLEVYAASLAEIEKKNG